MFLYFIEIYLLGTLLFSLLDDDLPPVFQAVGGIILGFLLHVLNGLVLIGIGIGLSQISVVIITSSEFLTALIIYFARKSPKKLFRKPAWLAVLGVGVAYVAALLIFYSINISFISNDSLYLILMGKDLIQSGFTDWYFASPGWTGPYIPMIHTIGMLFGKDYVWFVQPVLSLIFIVAFIYFAHKSVSRFISKKWASLILVFGGMLLFLSSDLPFVMLFYIHTNFSSGIFLFLAVMGLYFSIEEKRDGYLILSMISLISFGLLRIENVIIALVVILVYIASERLSFRQSVKTFIPYLTIQGIWFLAVYFMKIDTFLDTLTDGQILVMSTACLLMILVILVSQWRFIKSLLKWSGKLLPYVFLLIWVALGVLHSAEFAKNLSSVGTNLFISGNWGIFWWVLGVLALISLFLGQFPQKKLLFRIILSFLMVVQILGFFRSTYHAQWFDSANRMMIHIAPLVLFFSLSQIASAYFAHKKLVEIENTTPEK